MFAKYLKPLVFTIFSLIIVTQNAVATDGSPSNGGVAPSEENMCINNLVRVWGINPDPKQLNSSDYTQFLTKAQMTCDRHPFPKARPISNGFCQAQSWDNAFYCSEQSTASDCNNSSNLCSWESY